MKLGDMTFDDSRNAELLIIPIIEKIMSNSETAEIFNNLLGGIGDKKYADMSKKEKSEFIKKRVEASKAITNRLVHTHYEDTCAIFAILNKISAEEVKQWKRSDANAQIADMIQDSDLQSFFMSSDTLAQAVLSAI